MEARCYDCGAPLDRDGGHEHTGLCRKCYAESMDDIGDSDALDLRYNA